MQYGSLRSGLDMRSLLTLYFLKHTKTVTYFTNGRTMQQIAIKFEVLKSQRRSVLFLILIPPPPPPPTHTLSLSLSLSLSIYIYIYIYIYVYIHINKYQYSVITQSFGSIIIYNYYNTTSHITCLQNLSADFSHHDRK